MRKVCKLPHCDGVAVIVCYMSDIFVVQCVKRQKALVCQRMYWGHGSSSG